MLYHLISHEFTCFVGIIIGIYELRTTTSLDPSDLMDASVLVRPWQSLDLKKKKKNMNRVLGQMCESNLSFWSVIAP